MQGHESNKKVGGPPKGLQLTSGTFFPVYNQQADVVASSRRVARSLDGTTDKTGKKPATELRNNIVVKRTTRLEQIMVRTVIDGHANKVTLENIEQETIIAQRNGLRTTTETRTKVLP